MDLPALRTALAAALAQLVDIPFLSEGAEAEFFAGLLTQVFDKLPHAVRTAISSTAEFLPADRLEHYSAAILRAISPVINRMLFWRTNNTDVTQQITEALMLMASQGQDVHSLLDGPSQKA